VTGRVRNSGMRMKTPSGRGKARRPKKAEERLRKESVQHGGISAGTT
jgi:hypothetical protein